MNSFSYLKTKLTDLVNVIPSIRVRYAYDCEFRNHVVEIKPVKVNREDVLFAEYESALSLDFSDKFPYDSVIFISEDEPIRINYPDLVLEGLSFKA